MREATSIFNSCKIKFLNFRKTAIITACSLVIYLSIDAGFAFAEELVNPSNVRTAYLYHFMRFTDWPTQVRPSGNNPYTICIPKDSSEISFLDLITNKTVNNQPISIKQVDYMEPLTMCQILYLIELKPYELKQYIENINGLPILSVGNGDNFLDAGGIIAFNVQKGQVTFSVNLRAASSVNLKISANMLDVAEKVIK